MNNITRVAIDLAKESFQVCTADSNGRVIWNKQMNRAKLASFMQQLNLVTVAMESCATSNYWARVFQEQGHEVKLIHPQYVKPFVKTNKNDAADAEAILEASLRPTMRFVQPKSVEQQDMQLLHRRRQRLVSQHVATQNQARSQLAEYGIVTPLGVSALRHRLADVIEDGDIGLSALARETFAAQLEELLHQAELIDRATKQIKSLSRQHPACQQLMTIPGVGPIIATAVYATLGGPGNQYRSGRDFSASLGLVPRQQSTGGKPKLLGISKRGDRYLRTMLVQGAQATLRTGSKHRTDNPDRLRRWGQKLIARRGRAIAATAMANKLARICWAVMASHEPYQSQPA